MKTEFHFCSTAFNCTESKGYFINAGCFGDDVARWLMGELRKLGFSTANEPGQEDFGWYFTFHAGGTEHCVVITFQPNDPATGDQWLGWVERQVGFLGSVLGGRKRGILPEAVEAVDTALKSSSDIRGLTWHESGAEL
jgi:hypothetical protein